jgi:hypothetical protein
VFLIISYVYSSTKLDKRAEQVLHESKVLVRGGKEGGREGGREGAGAGGEMAQTMYAHMNK